MNIVNQENVVIAQRISGTILKDSLVQSKSVNEFLFYDLVCPNLKTLILKYYVEHLIKRELFIQSVEQIFNDPRYSVYDHMFANLIIIGEKHGNFLSHMFDGTNAGVPKIFKDAVLKSLPVKYGKEENKDEELY